jgi:hypothetical protein
MCRLSYKMYIKTLAIECKTSPDTRDVGRMSVECHSQEVPSTTIDSQNVSMGQGTDTFQNVKFVDTNSGFLVDSGGRADPLRDQALISDASLAEFFSRPVKIATYDWDVGSGIHQALNPWSLYFQNGRVLNRLANYRLLRSKLHIKVTISGNAFHYGRLILSYNPFPNRDSLTTVRTYVDTDLVEASQRPHIYLNPTCSQGGEMILPFFYYKNLIDITLSNWSEMGALTLHELQSLKHANGASDTVTINIFAWAEEIKFAVPTQTEPSTLANPQGLEVVLPQGDEYGVGPISRVAGVVAAAAGKLTTIPIIGPFARSTEIGASAMGALATLFGYSRPVNLKQDNFRPNTTNSLATTNIDDQCTKLTVDVKQELTIDPTTAGLDPVDELGINYIASKESYFRSFPWAVGTVAENLLYNIAVDPRVHRRNVSEYHLPACAYASVPFKYWRGSMKFRFQVVCSQYHKGRIKVVYDPAKIPTNTTAEYNTAYTTVIDISETSDFTITVGWGQDTTYREMIPLGIVAETVFSSVNPLVYTSGASNYGNGVLSVYVVNELTVPNTTANNDIEINVFVSGGDDLEFAVPTAEVLSKLRLTAPTIVVEPQGCEEPDLHTHNISATLLSKFKLVLASLLFGLKLFELLDPFEDVEPQGEEQDMESHPTQAMHIDMLASPSTLTDQTNLVHFGESIRSFRQLIKRYNLYERVSLNLNAGAGGYFLLKIVREILPLEGGYTGTTGDFTYTLADNDYHYAFLTLLKYITLGFGGWRGGTRWMFETATIANVDGSSNLMTVGVYNGTDHNSETANLKNGVDRTPPGEALAMSYEENIAGQDGIMLQSSKVNTNTSVEVPYYSRYRFTPAKQRTNYSSVAFAMPEFVQALDYYDLGGKEQMKVYVAAAEDFTCFMYLGPPVFYYESSIPFV